VITVLRESGYMPKVQSRQLAVKQMIQQLMRQNGTLGFQEFMKIMNFLRELDRDRLRKVIDDHSDGDCVVAAKEVGAFLRVCNVLGKGMTERPDLKALLGDSDGRRFLGREDVVILCQRVAAQLRVTQHERERQYVLSAGGWNESHFVEFRKSFQLFDDDMSEVLERD
ncbi:unnamed protein product, partial [Polarella glacialis]